MVDPPDGAAAADVFICLTASITWEPSLASGTQVGSIQLPTGMPPTKFKLAVVNNIGNALASSGNVVAIAPDKLNLNG